MRTSMLMLCLMLGVALAAGPANTPVTTQVVNDVNPAAADRAPLGPFSSTDDPPTIEWTFNCEFDSVYNVGVTDVQDSLCWVSAGQVTLQIGIYNIADPTHPFRTAFAQTGGPSGWGIRDMAYKEATDEVFAGFDGQRFHVYNATTHVPNNTYTISGYSGTVRGFAYNPTEDSCWTCNFATSPMAKFSITGTNGHQVRAAAQMASAYGLAWDANKNCFWMTNAGAAGASPFWQIDYPGYTVSDSWIPTGWDLGGGCEMWRDTFLLALEQATPDMIWCLRFQMGPPPDHDVGVTQIVAPAGSVNPGAIQPKAKIKNFGGNPESNIPVTCWIDSGATRVYSQSATYPGPLAPNAEAEVPFSPNWNTGPAGAQYNVTMFTSLGGDINPANDTMKGTTQVTGAVFSDTLRVRRFADFAPTIDGVINPGEWNPSIWYDLSDLAGRGGSGPQPAGSVYAYLLSDFTGNAMYFAMETPLYTGRVDYDQYGPYMDENHSGTWSTDSSEGNFWVEYLSGADSCVYRALLNTVPQVWYYGQVPGAQQASSVTSGHLQFETKVPFGTDKWHINVGPGDTVGYFQYVAIQGGGFFNGWWPQSLLMANWANPAYYGPMIFEDTLSGVETPNPTVPYALYKVSPSLVRDHANISYYVGRTANVELGVYDATGSLVKTLASGTVTPGERTAVWNRTDNSGNRVANGTYFYRLTVDGEAVSGKAIVLK